jgi:hypothetical protein
VSESPEQIRQPSGAAGGPPPELLAVSLLMAAAGAFLLRVVLPEIPNVFRSFGDGELGRDLGLLLAMICIVLGAVAVALLLLAWRIAHADRVARGLSYVLLGSFAAAIIVSNDHTHWVIFSLVASLGAIAILAWSPRVQSFFSEHGKDAAQPTPVVIVRTLVAWWASVVLLVGIILLPLGDISGKDVFVGLILIAIAATAFSLNRRLARGDQVARQLISGLPVAFVIADAVLGTRSVALIVPLGVSIGIAVFLWVPASSREFFDRARAAQSEPSQIALAPRLGSAPRPPAAVAVLAPPQMPSQPIAAPAARLACATCDALVEPDWQHCSFCGAVVAPSTATPAEPNRAEPVVAALATPMLGLPWTLALDTGDELDVSGRILIGRDPVAESGEAADHLVVIDDDTLSVSRTHVACQLDSDGFWVEDRGSTNGTEVELASGERQACEPRVRVPVVGEARVFFGDRWFIAATIADAGSAEISEDLERTQRRPRRSP